MSLHPSVLTVQAVKENVLAIMQNHSLTPSLRAALIATQLDTVNEWSDQINMVLDHPDAPSPANLVFSIRKDLFLAPHFTQCLLTGVPTGELPPAFPTFLALILKLIDAQKSDKEKPIVKVRFLVASLRIPFSFPDFIFLSPNALFALSLKRMSIPMTR
jgi:hypothetical protein